MRWRQTVVRGRGRGAPALNLPDGDLELGDFDSEDDQSPLDVYNVSQEDMQYAAMLRMLSHINGNIPAENITRFRGMAISEENTNAAVVEETIHGIIQNSSSGGNLNVMDDPIRALEEAIEADRPKVAPSPEWQKMLDAMQEEEAAGGFPRFVPEGETSATVEHTTNNLVSRPNSTEQHMGGDEEGRLPPRIEGLVGDDVAEEDIDLAEINVEDAFAKRSEPSTPPSQDGASESDRDNVEEIRMRAFAALQPVCSVLMQHRLSVQQLTDDLMNLQHSIADCEEAGVQECMDYVLFPLLIMMDSITAARAVAENSGDASTGILAIPAMSSDKAAEAAIATTLTLLQRCSCTNGAQLLGLLQRISGLLDTPRERTSEEMRLGGLRIVQVCSSTATRNISLQNVLRAESTAPLVGHLSSVLLKTAASELGAGNLGSKTVRCEALSALRSFVQAIDSAEALSFFLPGLMTGLTKAVLASETGRGTGGTTTSGAAAVEALAALTSVLVITLGNTSVRGLYENGEIHDSVAKGAANKDRCVAVTSADDALERLALLSKGQAMDLATAKVTSGHTPEELVPAAPSLPSEGLPRGDVPRLSVDRTREWVQMSTERIQEMLAIVFPPLAADLRPAVRVAVARASATLLSECSITLSGCRQMVLDPLLAFGQDDWPEVRYVARQFLFSGLNEAPDSDPTSAPLAVTVDASLDTWLRELPSALQKGDAIGRLHALKVTTCLQAYPPARAVSLLLGNSVAASTMVNALSRCFTFDSDSAALFLQAVPDTTGAYIDANTSDNSKSSTSIHRGVISLPRMPLNLQFVSTMKTYEAVAGVVRHLGSIAAAGDAQVKSLAKQSGSTREGETGSSGTSFRSLIDACLCAFDAWVASGVGAKNRQSGIKGLRPGMRDDAPLSLSVFSDEVGLPLPWQLSAAQAVVVLTELLFGASRAWSTNEDTLSEEGSEEAVDLEELVNLVVPELVDARVWNLETASFGSSSQYTEETVLSGEGASPAGASLLHARERGCNALLQRATLDAIGVAARALGPRFVANGRMLRTVLVPVLEKLADPCPMVAAAARTAIDSLCTNCGYGLLGEDGLRRLVTANSDYIIDGMCLRLRQLDEYPRAPYLFAALLRQEGVALGLVPLIAEPLRQALLGISIIARRQRPENVFPFVLCLKELAKGAKFVANEVSDAMNIIADNARSPLREGVEEVESRPDKREADQQRKNEHVDIGRIKKYFEKQQKLIDNQEQEAENPRKEKFALLSSEWDELQILKRRAAACSTLGQSTVDAAGPLCLSSSLAVAVQSLAACSEALDALSTAHSTAELFKKEIEPNITVLGGETLGPRDPPAATLLPSVHLLWSPLIGALGDWRVAVVERALVTLSHMASLAGSFLTRRFSEEAWPLLVRLLAEGPSQQRLIAPGQDNLFSPMAVQRTQIAVLRCLSTMASADRNSVDVVAPLAGKALLAVAGALGDDEPAPVREAATAAFVSLSRLDADAAWAILVPVVGTAQGGVLGAESVTMSQSRGTRYEASIPKGLKHCSASKLAAMMRQVSDMPILWHTKVSATM